MSDAFSGDHRYGLVCKVKGDQEERDLPLMLLEVGNDHPNHQLLDDYRHWCEKSGGLAPVHHPHASHGLPDNEQSDPTADRKTGRNDPCPCGSGKKYKKCCLRKRNGESIFAD